MGLIRVFALVGVVGFVSLVSVTFNQGAPPVATAQAKDSGPDALDRAFDQTVLVVNETLDARKLNNRR